MAINPNPCTWYSIDTSTFITMNDNSSFYFGVLLFVTCSTITYSLSLNGKNNNIPTTTTTTTSKKGSFLLKTPNALSAAAQ